MEKLIISILAELGLSRREAEIYCLLCKRGPLKASDISLFMGLNKVEVYRKIRTLEAKNFIEVIATSPKKFKARTLNVVIDDIAKSLKKKLRD